MLPPWNPDFLPSVPWPRASQLLACQGRHGILFFFFTYTLPLFYRKYIPAHWRGSTGWFAWLYLFIYFLNNFLLLGRHGILMEHWVAYGASKFKPRMFVPFPTNCYACKTQSFYFAKLWPPPQTFLLCWSPPLQDYLKEDWPIKSFKNNNIHKNSNVEYALGARPLMQELSQQTEKAPGVPLLLFSMLAWDFSTSHFIWEITKGTADPSATTGGSGNVAHSRLGRVWPHLPGPAPTRGKGERWEKGGPGVHSEWQACQVTTQSATPTHKPNSGKRVMKSEGLSVQQQSVSCDTFLPVIHVA